MGETWSDDGYHTLEARATVRILGILIKRELLDNLTSSRYVLASILCIALCLASIILMNHDYDNRLKRHEFSHTVGGKTNIFDWSMWRTPDIIAKTPVPLSLVSKGTEEVLGRPVLPQDANHRVIALFYSFFGEEHHLFDLFTTPDFIYIVSIVLSIYAVFVSFDAICGEKETGILRLLSSHSVPRSTILLAKWIGGFASFLVGLLPAIIIMLIYLTISGVPLQIEHWMRLAILICLSFAYLSVFFTLGVLISTLVHRSAIALVFGLVIWTVWALVIPRCGVSTSQAMRPIQPEPVFQIRKYRMQIDSRELSNELKERQSLRMNDAHIASVDSQMRMGQYISRLSPLGAYVYGATTLAQTGLSDYRDYRTELQRWNRKRMSDESPGEFVYQPLSFRRSLSEMVMDSALLLLWNILLFMGAYLAFSRYDVR